MSETKKNGRGKGKPSLISDYSLIEEIVSVNDDNGIVGRLELTIQDSSAIGMLLNSLHKITGGVLYLRFKGNKSFELYKGIGGKKTFPDATDVIKFPN